MSFLRTGPKIFDAKIKTGYVSEVELVKVINSPTKMEKSVKEIEGLPYFRRDENSKILKVGYVSPIGRKVLLLHKNDEVGLITTSAMENYGFDISKRPNKKNQFVITFKEDQIAPLAFKITEEGDLCLSRDERYFQLPKNDKFVEQFPKFIDLMEELIDQFKMQVEQPVVPELENNNRRLSV